MANRVYGMTEIVGTSSQGVDDAIAGAIARAAQDEDRVDWFEVQQIRGYVRDGKVDHVQVTLKVGYRMADK